MQQTKIELVVSACQGDVWHVYIVHIFDGCVSMIVVCCTLYRIFLHLNQNGRFVLHQNGNFFLLFFFKNLFQFMRFLWCIVFDRATRVPQNYHNTINKITQIIAHDILAISLWRSVNACVRACAFDWKASMQLNIHLAFEYFIEWFVCILDSNV